MKIPFIPENAPFNDDQKVWLSGFLAGLHTRSVMNPVQETVQTNLNTQAAPVLDILYGTQTGNAEILADDAAEVAKLNGFAPKVQGLDDVSIEMLANMHAVIIVISTYGEGEMPDNAGLFWDALCASTAPRLEELSYSVLALGDTSYDEFCHAGKLLDTRLEQLGAKRVNCRIDCDIDFEDVASEWINITLPKMREEIGSDLSSQVQVAPSVENQSVTNVKSLWTRKNPYESRVLENRLLSAGGSAKEIRHFSFALPDEGMGYEAGDALGVVPLNDSMFVDALIQRLGVDPDHHDTKFDMPIRQSFTSKYEIVTPSKQLIDKIALRTSDDELSSIIANGDKEAIDTYLWGKDALDLLNIEPQLGFGVDEFLTCLKPLQHRAYSISSSPKAHEGEVHLTVAAVRWIADGREHKGVCSTYLADQAYEDATVPIFMSPNKAFRLPENHDAPIIMVGPGTGVAPFRAFLAERQAIGAKGKNWLFFGDQHRKHDFIYEDDISKMSDDGLITRLDLAFSRDQSEKIYVQSRMHENGKELFSWLEEGAYFYVCGDATRMAKDVDEALRDVIAAQGGISKEAADEYVNELRRAKRYRRDVY